jgi:hypothetical protein
MRRHPLIPLLLIPALLAPAAYVARSQSGQTPKKSAPPPQNQTTPPAKEKPKVWTIQAEEFTHNDATGEGEARQVVATSEEGTIIRADLWKWNDKTKVARASGSLSMSDTQADATADSAEVFYAKDKKLIVLTGNVRITLKPKKKEETASAPPPAPAPVQVEGDRAAVSPPGQDASEREEARRYPVLVVCDKVEYQYARDKKLGKLTGNFKATQQVKEVTRTMLAQYADWFGLEERVLLHGPVDYSDTKGRKGITKEDVTILTKEGAEEVRFKKGTFTFEVEEEEEETAPPASPPTTPGRPPTSPPKNSP